MATFRTEKRAETRVDAGLRLDHGIKVRFKAIEARPAVQRNNALATEIRERMNRAAEGKPSINIYDTRDNAARLSQATSR
jgi:hypothetical protein